MVVTNTVGGGPGKPGHGIEIVSQVNDIPKGSRLAVSTNLLGCLIAVSVINKAEDVQSFSDIFAARMEENRVMLMALFFFYPRKVINSSPRASREMCTSAKQFYAYLRDAFDVLYAEGETAPKMMSVGLHLRIIGRPARMAGLEAVLAHAARTPGIHVAGIADLSIPRAREALARVGWPEERYAAPTLDAALGGTDATALTEDAMALMRRHTLATDQGRAADREFHLRIAQSTGNSVLLSSGTQSITLSADGTTVVWAGQNARGCREAPAASRGNASMNLRDGLGDSPTAVAHNQAVFAASIGARPVW